MELLVHPFFEPGSGSWSYVLADVVSARCAIIDPALGIDPNTASVDSEIADSMLEWIKAHDLVVRWILDTHVHADRPSAASYLKSHLLCAQTCIGGTTPHLSGYDRYLGEGDSIDLGRSVGRVLETPGHTPGCLSYLFDGLVFIGDTLFMPDLGTARCDFPGGNAACLYRSIQRLLALPPATKVFVCHDYPKQHERGRCVTSVEQERSCNIHVGADADEDWFVRLRESRDSTLPAPQMAEVAVPANLQCLDLAAIRLLVDGQRHALAH